MSYFHRVLAAVVLWAAYCSSGAAAQLTGSTVNVSAYYPDVTTVYADPGNVVVSDMIEYPSGSLFPYSGSWQIDLGASQMSITDLGQNGFPFAPETFNGFILRLVSGPAILSASVDPTSQFVPVSLTVEGGNRVLANYEGVTGPVGGTSIINIMVVPEPTTSFLALGGLAALTLSWHRSRRRFGRDQGSRRSS